MNALGDKVHNIQQLHIHIIKYNSEFSANWLATATYVGMHGF